ncbi:hypothetical protein [Veillonella magna]|uniref:ATPase dynein-related AAA domain-containing protein n=1 Tax=Veillonella magna TaxID=464322 RepID=A0ABS2GI00_9FIRM|nr:hypothetical protein [Veillonella magna]MBM6825056.1 hypothetical protein [Veillonella magna]MBM6913350.1 hypothetical protein [Veillonella magna]
MAYTASQAADALNEYMLLDESQKEYISETKNRGIVLTLKNGEKIVLFLYPLVHKQDNTKNYFDTRDSGAFERSVAWNYALKQEMKYFCLGLNSSVEKYQNYIFSLESNEKIIEEISGTKEGKRNGPGNQIIIPNNYIPTLPFERITNKLGIKIAVVHKDKIYDYISMYDNRASLDAETRKTDLEDAHDEERSINFNTGYQSDFERNRILFGAPGTGKSYTINKQAKELIGEGNENDYERVTFHPDYSYANFVGTYKPVMVSDDNNAYVDDDKAKAFSILTDKTKTTQEKIERPLSPGVFADESLVAEDSLPYQIQNGGDRPYVKFLSPKKSKKDISYEYVPGPFMRMYVKALKNSRTDHIRPFLLIIEEINRANVASVFGDIFQLLDRDENGVSEYPIQASEDIKKYLCSELGGSPEDYSKIRIPDNMFIWATMNSADQGVFPMDTAFKRRWDFTYLGINESDEQIRGKYVCLGKDESQKVEWNKLRKAINDFLANQKINEDKQLGPYFISKNIVVPENGDEIDREKFIRVFKNKVIMYLFEDAAKQKRSKLFGGCAQNANRYSEICREFDDKGINIFDADIIAQTGLEIINEKVDENE